LRFLKARVQLQRGTLRHAEDVGDRSLTQSALAAAFMRGLSAGLRLKPWRPPPEPAGPDRKGSTLA
jgi:hypothetical protein